MMHWSFCWHQMWEFVTALSKTTPSSCCRAASTTATTSPSRRPTWLSSCWRCAATCNRSSRRRPQPASGKPSSANVFSPGGSIAKWLAYLLPDPATPGLIPSIPKKFQIKIVDVTVVNKQRWLEESGQRLQNVDQTHLVLASGKALRVMCLLSYTFEWEPSI